MGKRVIEELFDDLDGSTPAITVSFGLGSAVYDIDLSEANRQLLQQVLAPFLAVARARSPHEQSSQPPAPTPPEPYASHAEPELVIHEPAATSRQHSILESLAGASDVSDVADDAAVDYERAAEVLSRLDRTDFLSWASTNGYHVSNIERVSPPVLHAYLAARHLSVHGESIEDIKRRTTSTKVRRWAAQHGHTINDRGRIPLAIWLDYANDTDAIAESEADSAPAAHEAIPSGSDQDLARLRRKYTVTQVRAWAKTQGMAVPSLNEPTPPKLYFALDRARQSQDRHQFTWGPKASPSRPKKKSSTQQSSSPSVSPTSKAGPARKGRNHDRVYPAGIREWARAQGYVVGRASIAPEIVEAFTAAHPQKG